MFFDPLRAVPRLAAILFAPRRVAALHGAEAGGASEHRLEAQGGSRRTRVTDDNRDLLLFGKVAGR